MGMVSETSKRRKRVRESIKWIRLRIARADSQGQLGDTKAWQKVLGIVRRLYDKTDLLTAENEKLRKWREAAEDFLGQRGVENISIMLEIIEAAIRWRDEIEPGGISRGSRRLSEAVDTYEDMISRALVEDKAASGQEV